MSPVSLFRQYLCALIIIKSVNKAKMNNRLLFSLVLLCTTQVLLQGQVTDSTAEKILKQVTITGYNQPLQAVKQLEGVHQTYIASGKKSEVITVQDLPANVAEKTGRQIFAKVPGAFVYDMDGSGNQMNIATRGLDPHRSWEFNVRQNGVMTNSDIYGYPASHYSPAMESVQRIEIIRGTASLQYGAQFGGMINYETKQADTSKVVGFESLNAVGSYGLTSTYNALGGRKGKWTYYAYYQRRISEGYRDNARSDAQSQFASVSYAFSRDLHVKAEVGRSQYIYRIPGPLTDAMFAQNPRQATRSRNYFNPDIYIPSITLDWKIGSHTSLNWITSSVLGARNSVQFIGFADAVDAIDPVTLQYKARQVDIDHFNSYSSELRLQHDYHLGRLNNTLVTGLRAINNDLHRQQLGKGTTGSDFDLSITDPTFGRDVHLKSKNVAFFVENLFKITPRLHISAGARVENGSSKMSGIIAYLPSEKVPQDIFHQFILPGVSSQFQINDHHKIYGGWSQAYRPVVFADIIPASAIEQADPNLENSFGHNAEFGIKGDLLGRLTYDLNVFQILYRKRVGSLILTDNNGQSYVWRTNIGDSRTNGVELYAELKVVEQKATRMAIFTATSYFDGQYLNGKIRNGSENTDLTGKRLETVPKWTSRNGLQVGYKTLSAILQYSYTADSYSDALNTETPSANGAKGLVPSYQIWDINLSYRFAPGYLLKFGVNNLTNEQYFTKRPAGYPGQGVWSSDGRSVVVSLGIRL